MGSYVKIRRRGGKICENLLLWRRFSLQPMVCKWLSTWWIFMMLYYNLHYPMHTENIVQYYTLIDCMRQDTNTFKSGDKEYNYSSAAQSRQRFDDSENKNGSTSSWTFLKYATMDWWLVKGENVESNKIHTEMI